MKDPYERVVEALEARGRKLDRSGKTICPAHADVVPSLKVSRGRVQPVVLHCHAGCLIEDVLAALDLSWSDLCYLPPQERASREVRDEGTYGLEGLATPKARDVKRMWERYAAGEIEPVRVELGPIPEDASDDHRWVAAQVRMHLAIARGAGITVPVPYSSRLCRDQMGWRGAYGQEKANKILRDLEEWGTFGVERLRPMRGRQHGTRAFSEALPAEQVPAAAEEVGAAVPAGADAVEADAAGRVDQGEEVREESAVRRAVAADGREVREDDG
jgi:hypothetical protein